MRAMFGDDERLRLGQIEHLTRGVIFRHLRRQRRSAFGTGRGVMIGDLVGLGGLPQGFALVTFCPPGFLSERSRRLLTRAGFFSPSLDGGLALFELFNPSRRSSSAIRAFRAAVSGIR